MHLLVIYFLVNNIECSNEILSHSVYVHSCIIFLRNFEVSKSILETNQVLHTKEMSSYYFYHAIAGCIKGQENSSSKNRIV